MKIRTAALHDARLLSVLIERAVLPHKQDDFDDEGWRRFRESNSEGGLSARLSEGNRVTLVAEEHDQIIGIISIVGGEKIDLLFVCPLHRRKGIASGLWRAARKLDLTRRTAAIYWVRSSSAGVPFYQRLGFTHDGGRQVVSGISFFLMKLHPGSETADSPAQWRIRSPRNLAQG